jgi:hypothetical protein
MKLKELFDSCAELSMSKRQDYTNNPIADAHENFKRTAELISWFKHDQDKAYVNHIATKLARLSSLLNTERVPNNESIEDSFRDLINYCGLWAERRLNQTTITTTD